MNKLLIDYIKNILESEPLDVYNEEEDNFVQSNLELVNSRFDDDSFSEEDRYIGSANIYLAAIVSAYASINKKRISELSDEDLALGFSHWDSILNLLIKEKFVSKINDVDMNIKLVVDNTK